LRHELIVVPNVCTKFDSNHDSSTAKSKIIKIQKFNVLFPNKDDTVEYGKDTSKIHYKCTLFKLLMSDFNL